MLLWPLSRHFTSMVALCRYPLSQGQPEMNSCAVNPEPFEAPGARAHRAAVSGQTTGAAFSDHDAGEDGVGAGLGQARGTAPFDCGAAVRQHERGMLNNGYA